MMETNASNFRKDDVLLNWNVFINFIVGIKLL